MTVAHILPSQNLASCSSPWSTLIPRFTLPVVTALLVTGLLLFLMARLIHTDVLILDEEPYPDIPSVVFEPRPPQPIATPKPEPVEPPEPQPAKLEQKWEPQEQVSHTIPRSTPTFDDPIKMTVDNSLPFARVMAPPVYPFRAAQRGIEGFVELRFDITASGVPTNIQVLYAEPQGVFENAAREAVARWRFQPNLVDGKPQPFAGLSKRIRFNLGD